MKIKRKFPLGWFLFGLGSQMQIVASLSFTELFAFLAAPLLLSGEWPYLKRNGILTYFWLSIAVVFGCAVSCLANHTPMYNALRGLATVTLFPCSIIVGHWMFRKNMNGFKWMIVGSVLSLFLCTFMFHQANEALRVAQSDGLRSASEVIMDGPIYWIGRLGGIVTAPTRGWYLQCPLIFSIGAPLFMAAFAMATSSSGRSAALSSLGAVVLIVIGGKKRKSMRRIGKYFWLWCASAVLAIFLAKGLYAYAALHDYLGEDARRKYEAQSHGSGSVATLLLSGRMASFAGLLACFDRPLIGFGPWAQDNQGYSLEFMRRFGDIEDYQNELTWTDYKIKTNNLGYNLIACHSFITSFWLWYGIFGLIFWLYVIFVFIRFLKQDCWVIPQWFNWVATGIPSMLWAIFFSPLTNRTGTALVILACLMARAVRKGRQPLPQSMLMEIWKAESK